MQEILISTVDIGSKKVSASLGKGINGEFDIISTKSVPSKGVEKGLIVDKEKCKESLNEVLEYLHKKAKEPIQDIYVGISNKGLRITETTVKISLIKDKVTGKDIKKALTKSKNNVILLEGEEVVDTIINFYILDGKIIYDEVVGWKGKVLEINITAIVGPTKELNKFKEVINESGYKFKGFIVNSISTRKVFIQGKKTMGVKVLIDVGAGTSDISIFRNGVLKYIGYLPLGGNNLTNDLSVCAEIPISEAEKIKQIVSSNYVNLFNDQTVEEIIDVGTSKISKTLLYEVIKARLEEILRYINNGLKNTSFCDGMCSIIIYGKGITFYENISELADSQIKLKTTIADSKYLEMNDTSNLTSLAMLKEVFDRISLFNSENKETSNQQEVKTVENIETIDNVKKTSIVGKLKRILKDYI